MSEFWSIRTLSYISALLQMSACIIVLLGISFLRAVNKIKSDEFGSVISLTVSIAAGLLASLIMGIHQNRIMLMSLYVYAIIVSIAICALTILVNFVRGLATKPIDKVVIDLFVNLLTVATNIILFIPIYILYKQMGRPSTQLAIRPPAPQNVTNVVNVPQILPKKKAKKKKKKKQNQKNK